jgi:hypothetical protein
MNEEQNNAPEDLETGGAPEQATTGTTASPATSDADASGTPNEEYYAVDHAKKDVISTIGDGEMHNEGLVGTGEVTTTDFQSSTERLADEQDEAELHDNEG